MFSMCGHPNFKANIHKDAHISFYDFGFTFKLFYQGCLFPSGYAIKRCPNINNITSRLDKSLLLFNKFEPRLFSFPYNSVLKRPVTKVYNVEFMTFSSMLGTMIKPLSRSNYNFFLMPCRELR